jgi:hypothetical protein
MNNFTLIHGLKFANARNGQVIKGYMISRYDMANYDISLDGNPYLRPGKNYEFTLRINRLVLDYTYITHITSVQVILTKELFFVFPIGQEVPCNIPLSLSWSKEMASWYPTILINGIDHYGYLQQLPFRWSRPIISTDYHPIYDARLGRSNWTIDENKIMLIKNMLNNYGFDCSTIGKEIQPSIPSGQDFIAFEKEWASGGHCFISVLTPRDKTADGRLALPPPWVQAESALSFDSDRPHLAFVEGVDLVAIYGQMDRDHVIMFRVVDNQMRFEKNVINKLLQFRTECQSHDTNLKLEGVGRFVFLAVALYGGLRIFNDLFV